MTSSRSRTRPTGFGMLLLTGMCLILPASAMLVTAVDRQARDATLAPVVITAELKKAGSSTYATRGPAPMGAGNRAGGSGRHYRHLYGRPSNHRGFTDRAW